MGCGHVQGFLLSHPLRAEETHTLFGPLYAPSPAV
jgi:EAL domain-containing protein (putative c-di-GMP-specific phosphodiesterase class I)